MTDAKTRTIVVFLAAMIASLGLSCSGRDTTSYEVTVVFVSAKSDSALRNVKVIAGSDKFSWPEIEAGSERSVDLSTEKGSERSITLFYTMNNEERVYETRSIGGDGNFKLRLEISGDGTVTERSCREPCSLQN
ncbi:MAG: hypothetical protein IT171_08205 [Acidobacteria bacterium]|nr:hypothetical protein [Acidobacteriota bacterium]